MCCLNLFAQGTKREEIRKAKSWTKLETVWSKKVVCCIMKLEDTNLVNCNRLKYFFFKRLYIHFPVFKICKKWRLISFELNFTFLRIENFWMMIISKLVWKLKCFRGLITFTLIKKSVAKRVSRICLLRNCKTNKHLYKHRYTFTEYCVWVSQSNKSPNRIRVCLSAIFPEVKISCNCFFLKKLFPCFYYKFILILFFCFVNFCFQKSNKWFKCKRRWKEFMTNNKNCGYWIHCKVLIC